MGIMVAILKKARKKTMKIDTFELRLKINQLHSEMGWVKKDEVKRIIEELEEKARSESEFYQMLETL